MRRPTLIAAFGVLICVLALAVGGSVTADSQPDHDVTIALPEEVHVGETDVEIVIENHDDEADLFAPVIEIPLRSAIAVSDPDPSATYEGTVLEDRAWDVLDSTMTDGESLFVYGDEVPAGTTKTYTVTLDIQRAGDFTLDTEVRPMYDEAEIAGDSVTATATAAELDVIVEDETGTPLTDATVFVDGEAYPGGSQTISVADGEREVGVTAPELELPTLTVDLAEGDGTEVWFTAPETLESFTGPLAVATTDGGTVAEGTDEQTITQLGDATRVTTHQLSFDVETDGGITVVAATVPSSMPPEFASVAATVEGEGVPTETVDDIVFVELEGETGDAEVILEFEGYRTGDATGDGTVTSNDATAVAVAIVGSETATGYADVTRTGELNAADAMMIAQYADDNRDESFERTDR